MFSRPMRWRMTHSLSRRKKTDDEILPKKLINTFVQNMWYSNLSGKLWILGY